MIAYNKWMAHPKHLIKSFFSDKNGLTVLTQPPNLPLIVWLVFTCISFVLPAGLIKDTTGLVALSSLFIWAVMEIISGASAFRRVLGVVILLGTLYSLSRILMSL